MTARNQSLDVLRGLAVLLVIFSHCRVPWLGAGWIGVDLFFVLSGFLISGLLFSELRDRGQVSAGRFLVRRGLKIYPAYFFFLGLTALLFPHLRRYLPMQLFFLQNYLRPAHWAHVLDPSYQLWDHTWSLAVEEHFYLALPILLILLLKAKRLSLIPAISFAMILVGFAVRWHYAMVNGPVGGRPMFMTHQRIDSLFCGVALGYLFYFQEKRFMRFSLPFTGALGVVLIAVSVAIIEREYTSPMVTSFTLTLNLLAFGMILLWAVRRQIARVAWLA